MKKMPQDRELECSGGAGFVLGNIHLYCFLSGWCLTRPLSPGTRQGTGNFLSAFSTLTKGSTGPSDGFSDS